VGEEEIQMSRAIRLALSAAGRFVLDAGRVQNLAFVRR